MSKLKILCVSLFDNGGSLQQLSNAINKYTEHTAKHLNFEPTWLKYDVDINGKNYTNEELKEKIQDYEFFIFSELIPQRFSDLKITLTRENTIIRCFGSITRNNIPLYRNWWSKDFFTIVSGGFDPTIHPYLGFVAYHIPNIYEFSDFHPSATINNKIRICQATTNRSLKDTDTVSKVFLEIEKKYSHVETIIIHKVPWKDTLKIKATCDITVDQFKLGTYASSAIESMYLQHAVISRISPFIRSMHPDIPIVQSDERNLFNTIENLVIHPEKIIELGNAGRNYAYKEHSAELNIIKWTELIRWIQEGFK